MREEGVRLRSSKYRFPDLAKTNAGCPRKQEFLLVTKDLLKLATLKVQRLRSKTKLGVL